MTAPEPSSLSAEDTALVAEVAEWGPLYALWKEAAEKQLDGFDWHGMTLCLLRQVDRLDRALADERRRAGEREAALRERVEAAYRDASAGLAGKPAVISARRIRAALDADEPTPPSHDESPETGAREDQP